MTFSAVSNSLRQKFEMKLNSTTIFFLAFSAFPVIFFSISKSKLPGYVLPAIPAFVFLTAYALAVALRMEKVPVPAGFAVLALTPVALMAAIGLTTYFLRKPEALHRFAVALILLAFLAISAALLFAFGGIHRATMVTGILAWLCFIALTNRVAMLAGSSGLFASDCSAYSSQSGNCWQSQGFPGPQRPGICTRFLYTPRAERVESLRTSEPVYSFLPEWNL